MIGSGLAGLTTAYLLSKEGCDVYLLEKVGSAKPCILAKYSRTSWDSILRL